MSTNIRIGTVIAVGLVCILATAGLSADEATADAQAQAQEMPAAEGMENDAGGGTGTVARSAFTSAIVEREPLDHLLSLSDDQTQVYYFTELHGLDGQTVVHRWEYEGQVMAEVPIAVRGPRWRVWSSKRLLQEWLGEWSVTVVDGAGRELARDSFTYTATQAQ